MENGTSAKHRSAGANPDTLLPFTLGGPSKRVIVHLLAMVVALTIAFVFSPGDQVSKIASGYAITAYVGLICLFPRGTPASPSWYLPFLTGLVQGLLVIILGMPWQYCFLYAGLQTWLSRLALTRGKMGWEWTVTPMLVIALFGSIMDMQEVGARLFALWSVIPLTVAGWIASTLWMRSRRTQLREAAYENAINRLPILARLPRVPEGLAGAFSSLARAATDYKALIDFKATDENPFAAALAEFMDKAEEFRGSMILATMRSTEADGTLAPGSRLGRSAASLQKRAEQITALAEGELQSLRITELGLTEYRTLARELRGTAENLPDGMAGTARDIADSAAEILRMMETDPADVSPGKRFLERYLKAACRITADYARLKSSADPRNEELRESLQKTEDVLSRIRDAFHSEQQALLQNDTVGLEGNLGALDSLLRLQGFSDTDTRSNA